MNKTYLNSNTYDFRIHDTKEYNGQPTMTVPDQSLTIPQILEMYSRGQSIDSVLRQGVGYDDPDFEDLDPTLAPEFDINDANRLLQETKERIKQRKNYQTVKPSMDEPGRVPDVTPHQKTIDEEIEDVKIKGTK